MNGIQNYVTQQLNKQRGGGAGRPSASNNVATTAGVDVAVHLHESTVFFRHFDVNETTESIKIAKKILGNHQFIVDFSISFGDILWRFDDERNDRL